jgi:aspartyl-tRNA(Asn)/glutamyl-tRNA(Gln) amidotransferase subunit A
MTVNTDGLSAQQIAQAVTDGKLSALDETEAALARIAKHDSVLNSFTDITADRARAKARAVDAAIAAGQKVGPLAGVPFAVKNLFDVKGLATRAGSKINRDLAPSPRDATLIERMEAQGAVLVGALNMGEYAYDFTGENIHDGPSRNPHDPTRMSGGSSGGSGSAVGGGLVPIALGSDTNGSIRVPSSFCGIFGLKPTYGRLSRARSFPFVASFDHLGPFARNVGDLALAYDAMQGPDADDAACTTRPVEPVTPLLAQGISGLRVAIAGGYFQKNVFPEAVEAVARVAKALNATQTIDVTAIQSFSPEAAIVVGGDGTLRGVVQEMLKAFPVAQFPPILVVPLGTANLMGRHLGITWEMRSIDSQIASALARALLAALAAYLYYHAWRVVNGMLSIIIDQSFFGAAPEYFAEVQRFIERHGRGGEPGQPVGA